VVGTEETPPFAMRTADGSWSGISIDLWRHVADAQHLRFSEEPTVQGLLDGIANGRLDIAVAALTETAARVQILDFTQPFYVTGLGIAVPAGGEPSWQPIIHTLTSFGFAQAIMALVGSRLKINYRKFANPQDGLRALRTRSLDAFIYDKPLLAWTIQQGFGSSIALIDTTFYPQEYAFAVPINCPLERTINLAILGAVHSDWWEQTTFRYLGSR
jgi:ABC-type amino acid transport substrate-binding protein